MILTCPDKSAINGESSSNQACVHSCVLACMCCTRINCAVLPLWLTAGSRKASHPKSHPHAWALRTLSLGTLCMKLGWAWLRPGPGAVSLQIWSCSIGWQDLFASEPPKIIHPRGVRAGLPKRGCPPLAMRGADARPFK